MEKKVAAAVQCFGHLRTSESTAASSYFFLVVVSVYLFWDEQLTLLFSFVGLPKHFTAAPHKERRLGKMLGITCGKDLPGSILTTG